MTSCRDSARGLHAHGLAHRHARQRVLRQRDVLVADPAVEVELQSLAPSQEGHRLTAPRVVQPVFAEENGGDGRRLVGCRLDRRDCHGCFASCSCPGGGRLTAGLFWKGPSQAGRRSTPCFFLPQKPKPGPTGKNPPRPPREYCPGGEPTRP